MCKIVEICLYFDYFFVLLHVHCGYRQCCSDEWVVQKGYSAGHRG